MVTGIIACITLFVTLAGVMYVLRQESGTGPRVVPREWLVVEARREGDLAHTEVLSGRGDAEVVVPGLSTAVKLVRDGHLFLMPGWSFRMQGPDAYLMEGEGVSVQVTFTDERPEGFGPRPV